jgi:hypothetical protein
MTAVELEKKYLNRIKRVGSLLLLKSEDAIQLLDDCAKVEVRFLGVEAFRLFENGSVQPSMDYSNISFGKIEENDGKLEVTSFERELHSVWKSNSAIFENTKQLIQEGTVNGYSWFEVSIEDLATDELLFFRSVKDGQ